MLRLWTYIPYRQRNMREMLLGTNLHKDAHGHWRITFRGDQLKVAIKRGQTNVFDLPFPKALVPALEEYLAVWRPILLTKLISPTDEHSVFLTQRGRPYNRKTLRQALRPIIYSYTGKHWHPHIIRTVWATEWIRNSGDFHTAAIMLNDHLETVIANYSHLLEEDVAEKAYRRIDQRNGQGT
jgi:site-specific recombinase XerD